MVGITRLVTELDPVTRKEVKHPLNEIASSHLAPAPSRGISIGRSKTPTLSRPSPATPKVPAPSTATAKLTSG